MKWLHNEYTNEIGRYLITEKKTWEEIRVCRGKFEEERKRENILRVEKWI